MAYLTLVGSSVGTAIRHVVWIESIQACQWLVNAFEKAKIYRCKICSSNVWGILRQIDQAAISTIFFYYFIQICYMYMATKKDLLQFSDYFEIFSSLAVMVEIVNFTLRTVIRFFWNLYHKFLDKNKISRLISLWLKLYLHNQNKIFK